MISLVDDIKKSIPSQLDSGTLPAVVDRIEIASKDEEFLQDQGSAKKMHELIDGLIIKNAILFKEAPELSKRLKKIETRLLWARPLLLDTPRSKELLSLDLVAAIKDDLDPFWTVESWLDFYEYGVGPDLKRRSDALYLISNNEEFVSKNKITLPTGEQVTPTVKNWIKSFISSANNDAVAIGNFEKINFLTNNSDAQKLTIDEKSVLSKIIDIYRLLKYSKNTVEKARLNTSSFSEVSAIAKISTVSDINKSISEPSVSSKTFIVPPKISTEFTNSIATKPQDVGFKSEFDQKLAAAGVAHGASLSSLRARVVERTQAEDKALSQKTPPLTSQEIKREVETPELPSHVVSNPVQTKPPVPKLVVPQPKMQPIPASPAKAVFTTPKFAVSDIKVVDDLKKLEPANLREGDLADQVRIIRNKVNSLAAANNILPFYAIQAFEQSPLYKAYMEHGVNKVGLGPASGQLNQAEFEAVADLRKELGHL